MNEASGSEEELIEALQGVSICVSQMAPLTERILDQSPLLELFCVGRGGPVNANLEAATRHGVAVTYAPGRNAAATAEHTVALILAAARRVPELAAETAAGRWRSDYYAYDNVGFEIEGSTVGIVGFGAVGRRVAAALQALGANVVVHDPFVAPEQVGAGIEQIDFDELLSRSRVVSLHARATKANEGMIGAQALARMPAGGVLVNCARGSLVDQQAVADALASGHLFGAAFDVFEAEPIPPDSPLLREPNFIGTPHVAGASSQVAHKAARMMAAEVGRFSRGEPLLHCANPNVLSGLS